MENQLSEHTCDSILNHISKLIFDATGAMVSTSPMLSRNKRERYFYPADDYWIFLRARLDNIIMCWGELGESHMHSVSIKYHDPKCFEKVVETFTSTWNSFLASTDIDLASLDTYLSSDTSDQQPASVF